MTDITNNNTLPVKEDMSPKRASAQTMLNATMRANNKSTGGFFGGNLGDSIERRFTGVDGWLGGGNDAFNGILGTGGTWPAQGFGNYYGNGLIPGVGRMYSSNGGGGFNYLRKVAIDSRINHSIIAQCQMAYRGYGIIRNIIDLYADFATEGIELDHPDKGARNFYRTWATKIKLNERVYNAFLNLFTSGTVFVHRKWAKLDATEERSMKRAQSAEMINDTLILRGSKMDKAIYANDQLSIIEQLIQNDSKAIAKAPKAPSEEHLPTSESKRIPWGYTFLNPLQVEYRGNLLKGDNQWVLTIDKGDALNIAQRMGFKTRKGNNSGLNEVLVPKEFLQKIKKYNGSNTKYTAEIPLTNDELYVLHAPGKWDWCHWATPFIMPALRCLAFKDCLRNMETRACDSVINSIYLWKLGNIEKGMAAEDEHFERLSDMLQMPGQTLNILWNDQISAEVVQADINGIFDIKKHESVDRDILTALGVPEVLLGGKGGNFSNSFIAVAGVLERLESYRNQVKDWLMGELKIIADAMGFQKLPTIRFGRSSLQDEKAYQTFLMGLYDRNIISADTILREANTDVNIEVSKLKIEKDIREKDILEARGPFIKTPPAKSIGPKTPNGRPPGSQTGPTGKQQNPRGPKGQNIVAEIIEMQDILQARAKKTLLQIEDFIGKYLLKAKAREGSDIKHIKQLRAKERERLEWLIYNVFSHMPVPQNDEPIRDDTIIHMLKSNVCEKIKADILDIYVNKVAEYSKTYGKSPTREMRRNFMCSAWTQIGIKQLYSPKAF